MSMFDSIINESNEKFGLGDKAGNLLSSLLNLITDQSQGGFAGFLERFRKAGFGDAVDTWVGIEPKTVLSGEQAETALGTETVTEMARQAGLDKETTRAALGRMIPVVVDQLTPDGFVPTEDDLLSRIGGFLSGVGGSTVSTTGVMTNEAVDRIGTAAAENIDYGETEILADEFNDDSPIKWLAPLVILILMIIAGWAFCGKSEPHASNIDGVKDSAKTIAVAG
jgi:uncharacterized protein YidB (DUF937 family)